LFAPAPSSRATQRFCAEAACRKASKAQSNAQWRKQNPGYDSGPHQVARVQRWRTANPGYSKRKGRKKAGLALQDLDPAQATEAELLAKSAPEVPSNFSPGAAPSISCNAPPKPAEAAALQDLDPIQLPLIVGLASRLMGGALQDTFAPFARNLVEHGRRVMALNPDLFGPRGAAKNTQPDLQL
jgi:hypothetical protein